MKRLKPRDRKRQIFDAAVHVAETQGYHRLTREAVALEANISRTLVNRYYKTITRLRNAVMRHAIKKELLPILANGIANQNPIALRVDVELKMKAYKSIAT